MKNIDFDDEYDPLLEVADKGYTPSKPASDIVDDIIKGIKAPVTQYAIKCVDNIINTPNGNQGDLVCETSTGDLYFMDHGCWVKVQ